MKIAILTINQPSLDSAFRLKSYLKEYDLTIFTSKKTPNIADGINTFDKLDDILPNIWSKYDAIICILAIGAVVRKIAPYLKDKSSDPAVIVINLDLTKIVPLLGGHIAGANELSQILTSKLPNSINFISTATDQTQTVAFDMIAKKYNWQICNLKALANISNRLLNKQTIYLATYDTIFTIFEKEQNIKKIEFDQLNKLDKSSQNCVVISPIINDFDGLLFRPKISIGIGCNRNTSKELIEKAFLSFLDNYNLSINDIQIISSFKAKADEKGLLEFAKEYKLDIKFYNKNSINTLTNNFSKSASTKFFGLKGVAEPCAVLSSNFKELIIPKQVYFKSITIAGAI